MSEAINREFELEGETMTVNETVSRSESHEETVETMETITEEVEKSSSMLNHIELDFEAGKRGKMSEAINREFELEGENMTVNETVSRSQSHEETVETITEEVEKSSSMLNHIQLDFEAGKRQNMLEAIEREIEAAAAAGFEQVKLNVHGVKLDDTPHGLVTVAEGKSKFRSIENEFEAARGKSMYEAINNERKFEGENKRNIRVEAIEAATNAKNGACVCFNLGKDGLKEDMFNIAEIMAEESKSKGSETSRLTTSLNNLVHTHRKETFSKGSSVFSSSSESVESLKQTLKKLRGLTARDLVNTPYFDEIIAAGTRYEILSSSSKGYISLLAKYKTVIKEGLEASQRLLIAQTRAKLLKETAREKQTTLESAILEAKSKAQLGDALHIKIVAVKKLLARLEAEKVDDDLKFKSLMTNLSWLLKDASQAREEYHEAERTIKEQQAAEEFALETTLRAESIWVQFLTSLD